MVHEIVKSLDDIIDNFHEFDKIREKHNNVAYERFKLFHHWYHLREENIFAPSKFIGYKGTTLENYCPKTGDGKDGRKTEKILKKYFIEIEINTPKYNLFYKKLEKFASDIDKELRVQVFIHIQKTVIAHA